MSFTYRKLWELLECQKMSREELRIKVGMSSATLAKLGKNRAVSMDVLGRICNLLNCDVGDIVEYVHDENFK